MSAPEHKEFVSQLNRSKASFNILYLYTWRHEETEETHENLE